MQRKLVQMGKHTVMTTIPSKWIQKHNLKAGNYIEFTEVDNKLVLTSTAEIFEKSTEINILSPTVEVIWRVIQPTYLLGYDEVKINFKDKKALPLIEKFINNLIGFEITEISSNYVKIKSVSKQLDEEFHTILRRVFFVLKHMADIVKESFDNKNKTKLEEIKTLENTINRYSMFLRRVINRTGYKYPHQMYMIISFLELSANHLEYIRIYFDKNPKIKIQTISPKEFDKLHDFINKVYDLYYNFSDEKFVWIAEAQPHFKWFKEIKDPEIRFNLKAMAEYLVQISRQIKALHT